MVTADSALRGKQATKADLSAVVAACDRWPGIMRARQVVEFADARSESALESISRVVFAEGGLPAPELQVWVGAEGRVIARGAGFEVVHFTWQDLHINPAQVLRSIRVAFRRSVAISAAAARPR